jgi:Flp pilus assembly protein TadG
MTGTSGSGPSVRAAARVPDRDCGAVTMMMFGILGVALAGSALIVDGGRTMSARRHASNVAEAAARAGASLDNPFETATLSKVTRRVYDYTDALGVARADVSISFDGTDVTVRITEHRRAIFVALSGIESIDVTESGTARTVLLD